MKLLIGHIGEARAGKETVSTIIAECAKQEGVTSYWFQFRTPLQETLELLNAERAKGYSITDPKGMGTVIRILRDIWGIPVSHTSFATFVTVISREFGGEDAIDPIVVDRPALQKIAQVMQKDDAFKKGALSRAVEHRVISNTADIVQIDGMRWRTDESFVRAIPGAVVLYTTANFEVRARRALLRRREGEDVKTIEQLRLEEQAENEKYIAEIGSRADHRIVNESDSLDVLRTDVEHFFATHVLPRVKGATVARH